AARRHAAEDVPGLAERHGAVHAAGALRPQQTVDKLPCFRRNVGVCFMVLAKITSKKPTCFRWGPDFQSQVAIFFRFMAAKTSIACMVTFSSPLKVVHRMPCFSFRSANTRSIVSFRCA